MPSFIISDQHVRRGLADIDEALKEATFIVRTVRS
jgi:hypothetical protein